MLKNILSIVLFSCLAHILWGQSDLAIGNWKSHLPYQFGRYVTQSQSSVYFATDWSVLSIDKEERSIDFISKEDGLSETGVGIIKYDQGSETLLVTYANSTIDLVTPDAILTIRDILNFSNLTIDKSINDIFINKESTAYLATGYGISRLDLKEGLFQSTTFSGLKINSVVELNGQVYAGTDEGVYSIASNSAFIENFNTWQFLGTELGLPQDYTCKAMTAWNDKLYFDVNDSLYVLDNDDAEYFYHHAEMTIAYLTAEGPNMLLGLRCLPDCTGLLLRFNGNTAEPSGADCVNRPLYAIEDDQQRVWLADSWRGIRVAENFGSKCNKTIFNSPYSHLSSEISVYENKVFVASSTLKDNGSPRDLRDGFFTLIEGQWEDYSERNVPLFKEKKVVFDFHRIAVRPDNGVVYVGSFQGGLVEWDGDNFQVFNEQNSSLQRATRDTNRVRISGLAFDRDNNLWISNHVAARPISVLKNDGTWKNFSVPAQRTVLQVAVDLLGFKWFVLGETGVMVFDDGGTIDDVSDDRYRVFTESNSSLPSSVVNCLELDLDGKIWVGTANGVVEYNCDPFDAQCVGTLPIVEENEFDDEDEYLLKGEDIRTIAVDGANRKWFGTTNGVFVQSENGREQVAFFNENNSPLPDNLITDIAFDHETGEVYIGTDKGLASYRAEATQGGQVNSLNAYAFPNPVRPGYDGPIAIKGMSENANVKITDVSGQLIFETTSLGGQAIWDGRDYNGRRASSGVYLVFSTKVDLNNPNTLVTKILVIN